MSWRTPAVLLVSWFAAAAPAQSLDYADLETRIEYAWFTEDANGVRALIQQLQVLLQKSGPTPKLHYLLAFAHYRRALLLEQSDHRGFLESMRECAAQANRFLDEQPRSGEGHALRAVCQANSAGALSRPVRAASGAMSMDKARRLAPDNPRVALLDAVRQFRHGDPSQLASLVGDFEHVLRLFERRGGGSANEEDLAPAWGRAEAHLYLGKCLEAAGEVSGARNAYERALILAPEYAAARRALTALLGAQSPR